MEEDVKTQDGEPVKKRIVIRRKPAAKAKAVIKTVEQNTEEVSPESTETAEETVAEAPVKKRGRRPKKAVQNSEEQKTLEFDSNKDADSDSVPASGDTQTQNESQDEPQEESESAAQEDSQSEDSQSEEGEKKGPYNGRYHHQRYQKQPKKIFTMEEVSIPPEEYDSHRESRLVVSDLSQMPIHNLKLKLAEMTGMTEDDFIELKKHDVISEILKMHAQNDGVIYAVGTLEVLPDGYGFLRSPQNSYLSGTEDVYVSAGMIKFLNLKTGDTVEGVIRSPRESERFFALNRIAYINGDTPIVAKTRVPFDSLTPLYPDSRINLETERTDNDVSMRVINLFCPIGKGQRALITAPPRTGKTILLQQIANAITTNHPEICLIVLLVDERPEEVTDMRRNVRGEVVASTFDEQATRHVSVAEMVIEKAKRLVEHKKDVVILLDSITRLARAYNQTVPASGKILSGGVDSNALHKPKRFFGAARNIENGGSLTIIASALIETGSRMDEVIFEEFKGTGNSEIVLDRMMSERRLFPAINIKKSGTRREDLLLEKDEANRIWILRNTVFSGLEDYDITEMLVDKMRKTKNNESFLRFMNTGAVPVN
ncbi:MAG: transcription termination factor Rho [Sphaerochaetaceae bacterium]|nr:transcription termination factor Rho [Sphaerochaetaceae bacterium]